MPTFKMEAMKPLVDFVEEAKFLTGDAVRDGENTEYQRGILELLVYVFGGSVNLNAPEMAELLGMDIRVLYPRGLF